MKQHKTKKLSLVGAGPGDPKLITLKGVERLMSADVVLYDALVDKSLLKYAPTAECIYVGKRLNNHRYSQDEINQLIVEKAFEHGHVVRLKGGDPFIFGRGAEEIVYAESFGIETEVIPGISSSTSVPSRLGISLTKRGVSESVWTLTGTTSRKKLSDDIRLAAQSTATLVILMGMSKLAEIVRIFKDQGKYGLPIAIIQSGYTQNEKSGIGTIETIEKVVKIKGLSNPAIIVIGNVVNHSSSLQAVYASAINLETQNIQNYGQ